MSVNIAKPLFTVAHTGPVQRGIVVFLHGSGDAGPDLWKFINHLYPEFAFRHLKIILPTAPQQPYTPANGELCNVWFDRTAVNRAVPEKQKSIDAMADQLVSLIKEEVALGTPLNRIVVGGFSMGGAMSLHLALRHIPKVAGVFALSSFINDDSILLKNEHRNTPPLYQWHGSRDPMVPMSWGMQSFAALRDLGVHGEFHIGQNALHELKRDCLIKLKSWIESRIPDVKQPKI